MPSRHGADHLQPSKKLGCIALVVDVQAISGLYANTTVLRAQFVQEDAGERSVAPLAQVNATRMEVGAGLAASQEFSSPRVRSTETERAGLHRSSQAHPSRFLESIGSVASSGSLVFREKAVPLSSGIVRLVHPAWKMRQVGDRSGISPFNRYRRRRPHLKGRLRQ